MDKEYIERDDAKRAIQRALNDGTGYGEALNALPAADVAPVVHGRWMTDRFGMERSICSVCGGVFEGGPYKYCHNCGAKMDEEVDDGRAEM